MKKLSPIAYRALFFKHVWRFIRNVSTPQELEGPQAVAVSGGIDSMTLLWVAGQLANQKKIGPVRAMFVNHHTREGQKGDQKVVEQFCRQEKIPLTILHAEGLTAVDSNFEARARKVRRDLCIKELSPKELLWVGHHLDDSYEWNFMQRHRSSNAKATVGIPVRNHSLIRPFLCVTKVQLQRLAKFEGIPYSEDPTNKSIKHDRNFIRNVIVPEIKKRYPKYLKFYSHFANFSAMVLKVNIMHRAGYAQIFAFEQGAILQGKVFSEIQIQEVLHNYSNTDRGKIISPIERMLRAIDNGKKGPFHFSGGMEASHSHGLLMIYRKKMINHDASIAKILTQLTDQQLREMPLYKKVELQHSWKNLLTQPDALLSMPCIILVLESDSICKTLNTSVYDARFPKVSEICKQRGLRFCTYQKCYEAWTFKSEKLPERLRLLPLHNLSNLFSSQR